jgi:hypothetical protein
LQKSGSYGRQHNRLFFFCTTDSSPVRELHISGSSGQRVLLLRRRRQLPRWLGVLEVGGEVAAADGAGVAQLQPRHDAGGVVEVAAREPSSGRREGEVLLADGAGLAGLRHLHRGHGLDGRCRRRIDASPARIDASPARRMVERTSRSARSRSAGRAPQQHGHSAPRVICSDATAMGRSKADRSPARDRQSGITGRQWWWVGTAISRARFPRVGGGARSRRRRLRAWARRRRLRARGGGGNGRGGRTCLCTPTLQTYRVVETCQSL